LKPPGRERDHLVPLSFAVSLPPVKTDLEIPFESNADKIELKAVFPESEFVSIGHFSSKIGCISKRFLKGSYVNTL